MTTVTAKMITRDDKGVGIAHPLVGDLVSHVDKGFIELPCTHGNVLFGSKQHIL